LTDANVESAVHGVGAAFAEMISRIGSRDRGRLAAQVVDPAAAA
jgi:hypothetical protein